MEYYCGAQGSYNISETCGDNGTYFHRTEKEDKRTMGKIVYIPFEIEGSYDTAEPGKYIYRGLAHCYNYDTHERQKVRLFVHSDQMMLPPPSLLEVEEKHEIDLSFWNKIRHKEKENE
jgi:hypothetical protein